MSLDFGFPGTPYPVQVKFMHAAYNAMSIGGMCVLESPTGTGKSLSLLCSCLAWLRDKRKDAIKERLLRSNTKGCNEGDNLEQPSWVQRSVQTLVEEEASSMEAELRVQRNQYLQAFARLSEFDSFGKEIRSHQSMKKHFRDGREKALEDADLLMETGDDAFISTKLDEALTAASDDRIRIIILSRTHSQISQLVKEMKKCSLSKEYNIVVLGSREQMCVNSQVSKSAPSIVVNEQCRNLVETSKCEFKTASASIELSSVISAKLMDIEEMRSYGASSATKGCPYFSARTAASTADIIIMPYSSFILEKTRDALGVRVEGNVVIFDEAHNVLDAINSTRSTSLHKTELVSVSNTLRAYVGKYASRLSPKNLVSIKQLEFLVNRFVRFPASHGIFKIPDFLHQLSNGQICINSVSLFLSKGDFCRKLRGFAESIEERKPNGIYGLISFLSRCQEATDSDRITVELNKEGFVLTYAAIDAEGEMATIVQSARTVLFVGGTMQPLDEFNAVASLARKPMSSFIGEASVGKDRLFVRIIERMSNEHPVLLFSKENRNQGMLNESLRLLLAQILASHARGGIVFFVPSYDYLHSISSTFKGLCSSEIVPFFAEKEILSHSELMSAYSKSVVDNKVSVLLAVVNGALSEGINFKDDLCRCVVVIGLPYGNIGDPILKERMHYFDTKNCSDPQFPTGRQYYESKCMKAVNQCVGRAIRHTKDWAAVLLVDSRYHRSHIQSMLPSWVRDCLPTKEPGNVFEDFVSFFESHKP